MPNHGGQFNRGQNAGTARCGECNTLHQKGKMQRIDNMTTGYICEPCWDMAGDENSVSDGYMTCVEFIARYGKHSEYCDCGYVPGPVGPDDSGMLTFD